MRLTGYIKNLGRAIAFYPGFTEKITNSTTATLLLCQLLYWTDKTTDGWIFKTHYELTEETGLTYYEQTTARKKLKKLGILEEKRKRIEKTTAYRINQDKLNDLWEESTGIPVEKKEEYTQLSLDDTPIVPYKEEKEKPRFTKENDPKIPKEYKGTHLDFYKNLPVESEEKKNKIREKLSKRLNINIDSPKWDKFIEYAYKRQEENGQNVDIFISYMLTQRPDPTYWGGMPKIVSNFIMWYPLAFAEKEKEKQILEDFVHEPKKVKEDIVEMPEEIRTRINKNKLF